MKSLLILFVIFTTNFYVFASPQERPPSEQELEHARQLERCSKQTGVDPNTLTNERLLGENVEQEVKCFHACMFKERRMMNDDGTINKAEILNFPPDMPQDTREKFTNLYAPCCELKADTDCNTAFIVFKCLATRELGSGK